MKLAMSWIELVRMELLILLMERRMDGRTRTEVDTIRRQSMCVKVRSESIYKDMFK